MILASCPPSLAEPRTIVLAQSPAKNKPPTSPLQLREGRCMKNSPGPWRRRFFPKKREGCVKKTSGVSPAHTFSSDTGKKQSASTSCSCLTQSVHTMPRKSWTDKLLLRFSRTMDYALPTTTPPLAMTLQGMYLFWLECVPKAQVVPAWSLLWFRCGLNMTHPPGSPPTIHVLDACTQCWC